METITAERQTELELMEATAKSMKGWPVGQRCRAVGFNVVTMEQLAERFACKAIAEAQNKMIREKLVADFCAKKGKAWEDLESKYRVHEESDCFRIKEYKKEEGVEKEDSSGIRFASFTIRTWDGSIETGPHDYARKKHCTVKREKLDAYMEEIPARVMGSLKVARECGLEKFRVAFPVLENEPQKNPVLLAKLGGKYLEIDMWE